nr:hypothetical protein CFP56_00210 [Quercus suber]
MKSPWDDLETLFRGACDGHAVSPSCEDNDSAPADTVDDMTVGPKLGDSCSRTAALQSIRGLSSGSAICPRGLMVESDPFDGIQLEVPVF